MQSSATHEKISPAFCLGRFVTRPYCPCCGGADGIRAARRKKINAKAKKPRYKDNRKPRDDKYMELNTYLMG